jgi:4-diphosphocytidyl-2-C-methyl-D-erythritol kinase
VLTEERTTAFAKVNLCLFVGPTREDGRHELVTLFESAGPDDDLVITPLASGPDEVVCPGVAGDNLATAALAGLREAGWDAPPVRVEITKRIPVAAGLGGGSADAAALLRCAEKIAPLSSDELVAIACRLGADVPSQLAPGPSIGTGAGEVIEPVPKLEAHTLLILPHTFGLATAEVYREADRLQSARSAQELASLRAQLQEAVSSDGGEPGPRLPAGLIVNDLQPAALALRPEIGEALEETLAAGADQALVCGSGPTVLGIFWGRDRFLSVQEAAEGLRDRYPDAQAAGVVERGLPASAPNE